MKQKLIAKVGAEMTGRKKGGVIGGSKRKGGSQQSGGETLCDGWSPREKKKKTKMKKRPGETPFRRAQTRIRRAKRKGGIRGRKKREKDTK